MRESSSPLRIAFLTHEPFYPPSGGGSAEAVYLVEEMVRRGHEVHLFCPEFADADAIAKKFGLHPHLFAAWTMGRYARWRNLKYLLYPFFLQRLVAQAAPGAKFDLLLSQHAISAVAAGRLKRRLNLPVVMNFPDLLTGFMETWSDFPIRLLVKRLTHFELSLPVRYKVDGVLAISDTLADLFTARGYPREQILPIYYGYDARHFPFQARTRAEGRPPVVVMHGSLDLHHLGDIAFDAVQYVTQQRPGTSFRFVGQRTATLEKFLARAQAAIPGFKFEAPGFVPYADVARHLADASVGMVPYEESSGTHCAFVAKVVEYVASGLPTVCTPLKSIRRYFQDDPMVRFSEFNGADFGKKIIGWLDAPAAAWQVPAGKSAARVAAELDWLPLCRKAIDFVESVYARSRH